MPSVALYRRGDKIGQDYVVKKKIGEGQFSEVYEVEKSSNGAIYAMKIEKSREVRTVRQELKVLDRLQGCRHLCRLYDNGSDDGRSYFIMQLLGQNLSETLRRDFGGRAPLDVVKVLAAGLLNALEGFHREGYIHRDVKPANFALDPPTATAVDGAWMLIDFGLARRYIDDDKNVLPEREGAGFRGSTTYASLNAHEDRDLGRRDDLWSWFYILVEMIEGSLPWRVDRDAPAADGTGATSAKQSVLERKRECMADPKRLFSAVALPSVVQEINTYLSSLQFADTPKYSYLRTLLGRLDKTAAPEAAPIAALPPLPPPPQPEEIKRTPPRAPAAADIPITSPDGEAKRSSEGKSNRAPLVASQNAEQKHRDRQVERRSRSPPPGRRRRDRERNDRDRDRERERDRDRDRERERERERDRDRDRDREHSRGYRSRSRSRSHGRYRRKRNGRDLSRSRSHSRSYSRSRSHSRTRTRSRSRSRSPLPGKRAENRSITLVDPLAKYQNTMEFIAMLRSGGISKDGAAAVRQLRMLQPAEAVGIMCLLIDELAAGLQGKQAAILAAVLEDLAAYSQMTASRCSGETSR